MIPVSPVIPDKNHNEIIVAEHQEEYQNLPVIPLENGILCRWELTEEEKRIVAETGSIYVLQLTGGGAVTPMLLQVEPPILTVPEPPPQMLTAPRRSAHIVNEAKRHGFEIFEGNCSECTCVVVFTGATKDTLAAASEMKIVCTVCFKQMQNANGDLEGVFLPNTSEEMARVREVSEKRKASNIAVPKKKSEKK